MFVPNASHSIINLGWSTTTKIHGNTQYDPCPMGRKLQWLELTLAALAGGKIYSHKERKKKSGPFLYPSIKVSPKYSSMVSVITLFAGLSPIFCGCTGQKAKRLWCSNGFRTRRCPESLQSRALNRQKLAAGGRFFGFLSETKWP